MLVRADVQRECGRERIGIGMNYPWIYGVQQDRCMIPHCNLTRLNVVTRTNKHNRNDNREFSRDNRDGISFYSESLIDTRFYNVNERQL